MNASTPQLSVQEAAHEAGLSTKTIRRMIARGELRAYRYGARTLRIDRADLLACRHEVNPHTYAMRQEVN